jgi:hypothetical protein
MDSCDAYSIRYFSEGFPGSIAVSASNCMLFADRNIVVDGTIYNDVMWGYRCSHKCE